MTPAKRRGKTRRPPTGGKRYEIVSCSFCGTEIYKRHLVRHIDQFHQGETEKTSHAKEGEKHILSNHSKHSIEDMETVILLDGTEFLLAVTRPGMPCMTDELINRVREFIAKSTRGKDPNKVQIQIDW